MIAKAAAGLTILPAALVLLVTVPPTDAAAQLLAAWCGMLAGIALLSSAVGDWMEGPA